MLPPSKGHYHLAASASTSTTSCCGALLCRRFLVFLRVTAKDGRLSGCSRLRVASPWVSSSMPLQRTAGTRAALLEDHWCPPDPLGLALTALWPTVLSRCLSAAGAARVGLHLRAARHRCAMGVLRLQNPPSSGHVGGWCGTIPSPSPLTAVTTPALPFARLPRQRTSCLFTVQVFHLSLHYG